MHRKTLAAVLVSLLFFLSACSFPGIPGLPEGGTHIPPTTAAQVTATAAAPATAAATQPGSSAMVLTVKESHETSTANPKYQLDARWPYLEWNGDPRAEAFNQAAEAFATGEVQHFKENALNTPSDPVSIDKVSAIDIQFSQVNETNGILSILFKVYFYAAGAAHPGHYSHAINYDLRLGKVIELSDLFQPGAAYLDSLSSICIADLKARNVLAWEDGALPKAENYQVWNITPEGLLITFDEYQVAPYASGPTSVTIPYARLKDLARPDGPLSPFLK